MATDQVCRAPHGTVSRYTIGRCRCDECRTNWMAHKREYRRRLAYARWRGVSIAMVDAAPVRAHVRRLMAAGEAYRDIATRAGQPVTTVCQLLYGKNGQPRRKVRPALAEALLRLEPSPDAPLGLIDATGTRRRAEALLALGWSYVQQAHLTPLHPVYYSRMLKQPTVTRQAAGYVSQVYEKLSGTPAPDAPGPNRARALAAKSGFPPPLAWDDATIDDPAARPEGLPNAGGRVSRLDRATSTAVDDMAVARVVESGRSKDPETDLWRRLNDAERRTVVARLVELRWHGYEIMRHLHLSNRTLKKYMEVETCSAAA